MTSEWRNDVLVIVGNRFGLKTIANEYFPAIKRFMRLPSFVGLIGGKPNFAYYFCGFIDKADTDQEPLNQLIFLDPHIVRASSEPYSCSEPRILNMEQLDPCLSFGFLIKSEEEFLQLQVSLVEGVAESGEYSIFHITGDPSLDYSIDEK